MPVRLRDGGETLGIGHRVFMPHGKTASSRAGRRAAVRIPTLHGVKRQPKGVDPLRPTAVHGPLTEALPDQQSRLAIAVVDRREELEALSSPSRRVTMSYMKTSTITIRLDESLGRELDQACARTGRTRSELARDALRRQLALLRFERLRKRTLPLAEAQGYLTDEDIFRDVS